MHYLLENQQSHVIHWYFKLNILDMEYMLCILLELSQRNKKEGSEGWNCNIRRENGASRVNIVHSERWLYPEGKISRDMLLMKCYTFKASSTCFNKQIQKVKKVIWQDTKEALTSLNSWQTNKRLLFYFCVSFREREKGRLFLFYPIVD